jgi:hypothetical protein
LQPFWYPTIGKTHGQETRTTYEIFIFHCEKIVGVNKSAPKLFAQNCDFFHSCIIHLFANIFVKILPTLMLFK